MRYSLVKDGSQLPYFLKEAQLLRLKSRIEDNTVPKSFVHFLELFKPTCFAYTSFVSCSDLPLYVKK